MSFYVYVHVLVKLWLCNYSSYYYYKHTVDILMYGIILKFYRVYVWGCVNFEEMRITHKIKF